MDWSYKAQRAAYPGKRPMPGWAYERTIHSMASPAGYVQEQAAAHRHATAHAISATRAETLWVAGLSAVAFVLRIVWWFAEQPTQITWDGAEYARIAQNLRDGLGYVGLHGTFATSYPPLYSMAVAAASYLFPSAEIAGQAVSIVAGAAFVPLVYGCARFLGGVRAAVLAAVIAASLPFAVDISTVVLSDALFMTLAAAGLYFALRHVSSVRRLDAVLSGVFFGLGYLTRPEGLLMGFAVMASLVLGIALRKHDRAQFAGPALGVAALILTALPYTVFYSAQMGHFELESKSAVNFVIARGMQAGLSYNQAADNIDDSLHELGPEINATAPAGTRLTVPDMVRLALADAGHHVLQIPRTLVARVFGTPLLLLAAMFGFLAGSWTRRRLSFEIVLVAYCIAEFMALSTVYQFWDRYADNFIIAMAIWGGIGIDKLCTALERRRPLNLGWPAVAVISVFFVMILIGMRGYFRIVNESRWMVERTAGEQLLRMAPHPGAIASVSDQPVYYARGTWVMLPWAPSAKTALAYLRKKNPAYVILDRYDADERSYVEYWLDHGIPDPRAHLRYAFENSGRLDAAIYQWGETTPAR